MTKEQAKQLASLFTAYAEGKTIQKRERIRSAITKPAHEWRCKTPLPWDDMDLADEYFDFFMYEYRIKPEATWRAFKDGNECWQEMQKHQPFGWIKDKGKDFLMVHIHGVASNIAAFAHGVDCNYGPNYDDMLRCYTFADGTPFGVKEYDE